MINRRNTENRVNKINEAALRFVYDDSVSLCFDELLINGKSVIIHQRNLHFLATENFKVNFKFFCQILNYMLDLYLKSKRDEKMKKNYVLSKMKT